MKRTFFALISLGALLSATPALAQSPALSMNTAMVSTQNPDQTETFNQQGSVGEIFAAQKQMTYHIMRKMGVDPESLPPETRAEIAQPQTTSVAALQSFSKGIDALDNGNFADARMAFSQAAAADPGFTMAKSMQAAMPEMNSRDMVGAARQQSKAKPGAAKRQNADKASRTKAENANKKTQATQNNKDSKDVKGGKDDKRSALVKHVAAKAKIKTDKITQSVTSPGDDPDSMAGLETLAAPPDEPATGIGDSQTVSAVDTTSSTGNSTLDEVASTSSSTTDLTSNQSVIDTYSEAEQNNLVDSNIYSNTQPAKTYKIGGLALSYIIISNDSSFVPNNPHYSQNIETLGDMSDPDFIFASSVTLAHSGYANGYIKYDVNGNMTGFADMDDVDSHFYNDSISSPHNYNKRTRVTLANGEFVEAGYVTTADFSTIDATPYNYLSGSMDIVSGVMVNQDKLTDLHLSNAVYDYSGSIYATIAEYNTSTKTQIGIESGSGTFTSQVDFGASQVKNVTGTVTTSNYKFNLHTTSSSLNTSTGGFESTSTMDANSGYSGTTYGVNEFIMEGNIFGSEADGIAGVFSGESNGPTDIRFFTTGSFAGKKD